MFITTPLYSLSAWKRLSQDAVSKLYKIEGSNIFKRHGIRNLITKDYIVGNPRTLAQQSWRGLFAEAVASWQDLPGEEKASWKEYQDHRRRRPVMDGYNLYISKWLLSGGDPKIPPDGRKEAR